MLTRVPLSDEQVDALRTAMDQGDEGLHLEMSTNVCSGFRDFLATRVLPLPQMDKHFQLEGEERDYDIMLMSGNEGYVILQQMRREGCQQINRDASIEVNFVLRSDLPFMQEHRQDGWPLRVRRMMLEAVQWKLDHGKALLGTSQHPLWLELAGKTVREGDAFFGQDTATLVRVMQGQTTADEAWKTWASDEDSAKHDLGSCLWMGQVIENLMPPSKARP